MSQTEAPPYDVAIIGGGPAGLSAALFTARHGLRTIVFDRGTSQLRQCAYLDNYLGFPGGIDAAEFLQRAHVHAEDAGCLIVHRRVLAIASAEEPAPRFVLRLAHGEPVCARACILASGHETSCLRTLAAPSLLAADGTLATSLVDARGRTPVPGLYVTGALAGIESQAIVSAGHGAQVALALVHDLRRAAGYWEALARHLDWQVRSGVYDTSRWRERVIDHFDRCVPPRAPEDEARFEALLARWIEEKRAQQLDRAEVRRRRERGRRLRATACLRPQRDRRLEVGS